MLYQVEWDTSERYEAYIEGLFGKDFALEFDDPFEMHDYLVEHVGQEILDHLSNDTDFIDVPDEIENGDEPTVGEWLESTYGKKIYEYWPIDWELDRLNIDGIFEENA